jgi:hypothetical protein
MVHMLASLAGFRSLERSHSVTKCIRHLGHIADVRDMKATIALRTSPRSLARCSMQQMLLETSLSSVEIALSVGFRSQSHFTSVFTKFIGRPPQKWKRHNEMVDVPAGEIVAASYMNPELHIP